MYLKKAKCTVSYLGLEMEKASTAQNSSPVIEVQTLGSESESKDESALHSDNERDLTDKESPKTRQKEHTKGKVFACSYCGKGLASKQSLSVHKRIHTGENPYSCNECGKKFNHSSNLSQHRKVHTGEKPYGCDACAKRFIKKSDLSRHINRIHTSKKRFSCDECGKGFCDDYNLNRHKKLHSGEKRHHCDECGRSFIEKSNLSRHVKIHSGERSFSRDECGRNFHLKSDLRRHESVYTGEKRHRRNTRMPKDPPGHDLLKCSDRDYIISQHRRTLEGEESMFVANGLIPGVPEGQADSLQKDEGKTNVSNEEISSNESLKDLSVNGEQDPLGRLIVKEDTHTGEISVKREAETLEELLEKEQADVLGELSVKREREMLEELIVKEEIDPLD